MFVVYRADCSAIKSLPCHPMNFQFYSFLSCKFGGGSVLLLHKKLPTYIEDSITWEGLKRNENYGNCLKFTIIIS